MYICTYVCTYVHEDSLWKSEVSHHIQVQRQESTYCIYIHILSSYNLSPCNSTCKHNTVEPPNTGHTGDNINPADLLFVERISSLGGSKCTVGIILGLYVMSFVERDSPLSEVSL